MTSIVRGRLLRLKHYEVQDMAPVPWFGRMERCAGCRCQLKGIIFPRITCVNSQKTRRLCDVCYPEWQLIRQPYLVAREMMK